MYLNMTEQIAAGELPESLEDLTRLGAGLMKIGAKVRQTMAVIVAEARMNHFAGDLAGWTTWCTEEFALTTNTRSHLWAIGEMLLGQKGKTYRLLFTLDSDKLLALSAVHRFQSAASVTAMASQLDLAAMSRAQVRNAVSERLGDLRPAKPQPEQPSLPGWDEIWAAASNFDDDDFARMCDTPEKATRSMELGIGFLSGALEYSSKAEHRDTATLAVLKSVLLDQLAAIEAVLTEG